MINRFKYLPMISTKHFFIACHTLFFVIAISPLINAYPVYATLNHDEHGFETPGVELTFFNIEERTLDGKPCFWLRIECVNHTQKTYTRKLIRAFGLNYGQKLYSASSPGFHRSRYMVGVNEKKKFRPGEFVYVAFYAGIPSERGVDLSITFYEKDEKKGDTYGLQFDLPPWYTPTANTNTEKISPPKQVGKIYSRYNSRRDEAMEKRKRLVKVLEPIGMESLETNAPMFAKGEVIRIAFSVTNTSSRALDWPEDKLSGIVYCVRRLDGEIDFLPTPFGQTPVNQAGGILQRSKDITSNHLYTRDVLKPGQSIRVLFRYPSLGFDPGRYRVYANLSGNLGDLLQDMDKSCYGEFDIVPYAFRKELETIDETKLKEHISARTVQAFHDRDFVFLEGLSKTFRENNERTPGGMKKTGLFYQGFEELCDVNIKHESFWSELKDSAVAWVKDFPDSPTPYIVLLIVQHRYVLHFTGDFLSPEMGNRNKALYKENLLREKEFLDRYKSIMAKDPFFHDQLTRLTKDLDIPMVGSDNTGKKMIRSENP